jgi:hypothetical protein
MLDHVVVLLVALIAAAFVVKHLRAILFVLAFAVVAVLFIGIIQIMPFIAEVIQSLQTATGS